MKKSRMTRYVNIQVKFSKQKKHAPFAYSISRRQATAKIMADGENDAKELELYRALAKFSQHAWRSWNDSLRCSTELLDAIKKLLNENPQLPNDLVGHIIMTIDTALYQDCNNSRSSQRRNRVAASRRNLQQFSQSLVVLYKILRELNFKEIYNQIDGSLFCRNESIIFIFPGHPTEDEYDLKGWRFSHRKFVLPSEDNGPVEWIPFNRVQHVVHNVEDLLNILNLIGSKPKSDDERQVCLKGRPNFVYNGPDLIWFSPVPPPKSTKRQVCASLDPDDSRYGCFRLTLPFRVIERNYSRIYCLGTRKYNQEYCHSYLFTPDNKFVTFIEELEPIELASSEYVRKDDSDRFYWLCYREDQKTAWDLVDFAVSASELKLSIKDDEIRLDFVDHCNFCVPAFKGEPCNFPETKNDAKQRFLEKLKDINIDISKLKNIFEDEVYNDLIQFTT
jgi:hypothetical protein